MAKNTIIVSVLADTKKLASGFQESTSVLGRVTDLGKGILKTTAGITAAVVGLAAVGGFARALKLDEARTQLKALGYSGEQMQSIMDSALASVKGSAFGLDAAATVAANALASGIKPGQQLTASLTTVANTAALAKVDMGEMGSIFQKVWANGKVTTAEMNQLADRGVPIWQYLSATFGKSNSELRKMIEAGEVTSDMFMNSLGPAVEGMATAMSSSFRGMAANAFAALSRVGAMFAGPLLDSAKGFLGEATTLTDGLGQRLAPVADKWAAFLGHFSSAGLAAGVLTFLDRITAGVGTVASFVAQFSPLSILLQALAPVLPQLAGSVSLLGASLADGLLALGPSLIDVLGSVLVLAAQIIPPVASLASWAITVAAGIVSWVIANREWLSGLAVAGGVIAAVVVGVKAFQAAQLLAIAVTYGAQGAMLLAGGAAKVFAAGLAVVSTASQIAAVGTRLWNAAMNANPIMLIVTAIAALVAGLIYFFTQTELGQAIWKEFTRFLSEAWNNIVTVATTVFTALVDFFTGVWEGIVTGWQAVADFFAPLFEFIGAVIGTYIEIWKNIFLVFAAVLKVIWDGIVLVVTTVWQAIVDFLTPIIEFIVTYITTYIQLVQSVWNAVWGAISSFFTGIWNAIVGFLTPILTTIFTAISGVVRTVQGIWNSVWGAVSSFFTGIWNGIVSVVTGAVGQVIGVVSGIQSKVMGALAGVGSWLLSAGRNLVQGFWNGISGMAGWLRDQVMGFFDGVVGWAKGVLGIKSPSRVFKQIGGFVGQGLAEGLERTESLVAASAASLGGAVIDGFDASLDGGQVSLSVADNQPRDERPIIINLYSLVPTAETGRTIMEAVRVYEAAGGRA